MVFCCFQFFYDAKHVRDKYNKKATATQPLIYTNFEKDNQDAQGEIKRTPDSTQQAKEERSTIRRKGALTSSKLTLGSDQHAQQNTKPQQTRNRHTFS